MFLRVWDTELIDTTVRVARTVFKGASVYPFFQKTGKIKYLMLVLPESSRVFMVPYKKGIIRAGLCGNVRMNLSSEQLKKAENFYTDQFQNLFHYDTQWVLSQEKFSACRAKDILGQTNCADVIREHTGKPIGHLRFTRDLSKLTSFAFASRGLKVAGTIRAEKVLPFLLEAGQRKGFADAGCGKQQWVMDPVWQTWCSSSFINWR